MHDIIPQIFKKNVNEIRRTGQSNGHNSWEAPLSQILGCFYFGSHSAGLRAYSQFCVQESLLAELWRSELCGSRDGMRLSCVQAKSTYPIY